MRKIFLTSAVFGLACAGFLGYQTVKAQDQELSPEEEIRLVQEFNRMMAEGINPGEIWAEMGKEAFKKYNLDKCDFGLGPGKIEGALAQLPRYFPDAKRVMDLETRIGWCLQQYAGMTPEQVKKFVQQCWGKSQCMGEYDAIVMYVSMASNGQKINVNLKDPQVKRMYEIGKQIYYARLGPWDFNCATCHAGQKEVRIRATVLWSADRPGEAGKAVSIFPKYLVRWSQPMTMHYRYSECMRQMRWPAFEPHSDLAVALSAFLYGTANGTEIKVPGIGR
jgi:sulfur-oxidizing protein SoxA